MFKIFNFSIFFSLLFCSQCLSQNNKIYLHIYAGPSVAKSTEFEKIHTDFVPSFDIHHSNRSGYSFGMDVSIPLSKTFALNTEFGFQSKGKFKKRATNINYGSRTSEFLSGTELQLLHSSVSLEKNVMVSSSGNFRFGAGLFYGFPIFDIGFFHTREIYNDFGMISGVGYLVNKFSFRLAYEHGFVDVVRDPLFSMKTSTIRFKFGFLLAKE